MCAVSALYRHKGFKFPNLSKNHWPNVLQNSNLLHVLEEFPQHFHVRAIEMPRRPTGSHAAAEFRKFRDGSEGIADLGLRACVSTSQQNSNTLFNRCNSVVWSRRGMRGKVYHPDVMSLSQRSRHHPEIFRLISCCEAAQAIFLQITGRAMGS